MARVRRDSAIGMLLTVGGLVLAYSGAFLVHPEPGGASALAAGWMIVGGYSLTIVGVLMYLLGPRF